MKLWKATKINFQNRVIKIKENKIKMSEQIQSLLNEMESKFEQSFSQSNLQEPVSKQLNPQSAKKALQKLQISKPQQDDNFEFQQMKDLLLKELTEGENNQLRPQAINQADQSVKNNQRVESRSHKRQGTPNFKTQQYYNEQDLQQLRQASSQQQFHKDSNTSSIQTRDNPFYYKQLTMKLQKALLKISSEKVMPHARKTYNFYDRIEQFQQKKKREIQRRKQQLEEQEISSVKDRPLINSHSQALVAQVGLDPIYVRSEKILENRKMKDQQNKKIKEERQEKAYEEFKKQFDEYMSEIKQKYEGKSIRTPEEYYHEMQSWAEIKKNNIQAKIKQKDEKVTQQMSFKPLINSKSQKIIAKNHEQPRVPIYERQPVPKTQKADPNCTFKPKINKSNFYKKMSAYQAHF